MTAETCPVNPPGHDWDNGLTCRWCEATRTAAEAIVSGLASRRGGDEESALRLLAAFRAEDRPAGDAWADEVVRLEARVRRMSTVFTQSGRTPYQQGWNDALAAVRTARDAEAGR